VEKRFVVKTDSGQLKKVVHVIRGNLWKELQPDISIGRMDDGPCALHGLDLCLVECLVPDEGFTGSDTAMGRDKTQKAC
jgi:hypothetical protein